MVDDQLWGAYIRAGKELNSVDGATVVSIEEGQVNRIFVNYEDPSLVFEAPLRYLLDTIIVFSLINRPSKDRERGKEDRNGGKQVYMPFAEIIEA